ncbi:MAG TPA: hypothetical protein VGD14_23710 [bacterium]
MIDNNDDAMELVHKMEEQLPIIVNPGKVIIQVMRERGIKMTSDEELPIERVHYLGDEGGIGCGIILPIQKKEVMVVSLTHLRVIPGQPLSEEIQAYQIERNTKLMEINKIANPFKFLFKPSKKKGKKK